MKKLSVVLVLALLLFTISTTVFSQAQQAPEEVTATETVTVRQVAAGFTHPLVVKEAPDDSGRLFVVDQTGQIWIVTETGELLEEPFLDISDRLVDLNPNYDERGLLGLAFHPDYADNGRFFVYYSAPLLESAPDDWDHTNVLSEFQVSAGDANVADPGSEAILIEQPWPYSNHNGGTIAFGPDDGMLYLAWGDGGRANDTDGDTGKNGHVADWYAANDGGNGQDIEQNPMGSFLRLDVSTPMTYTVPADNPFVGELGSDLLELQWAYGFRNPYQFSFDMGGDHQIFVGDAGQGLWEEVDIVTAGGNYGWNVKEGIVCFDASSNLTPMPTCPDAIPEDAAHPDAGAPLLDPVLVLPNTANPNVDAPERDGQVIVGGYVHRSADVPNLNGRYIFGVWSGGSESGTTFPGELFVATESATDLWDYDQVHIENLANGDLVGFLLGFGQDSEGDVYVLTTDEVGPTGNTGRIWKIEAAHEIFLPIILNEGLAEVPGD